MKTKNDKETKTKKNTRKSTPKKEVKEKTVKKNPEKKENVSFDLFEVIAFSIIFLFFGIVVGYILNYGRDTYTGKKISKDLEEFIDTYQTINENYYGNLKESQLVEAAINGMVQAIDDPYSSYMDENSVEDFNDDIIGTFVGIGVVVQYDEGNNKIIEVYPDAPADKAGLKEGDIIVKVDGDDTSKVYGDELSKLIRGEENTNVNVTVKREDKELSFDIKRGKVDIISVTSDTIVKNDKKVGVLKVTQFASNTYDQFNKELKKLEKENIDSLVIDVRSNLGGQLIQTRKILNLFFDKKTLLFQIEDSSGVVKVKGIDNKTRDYPVAVLINGISASASEVVAACFKDNYKDAYIVGEKSYGKGTVQQTVSLKSGSKVKYTTQKWLTPKGKCIEGKGVKPDYEVENDEAYYNNPTKENDKQLNKAIDLLTK